MQRTLKLWIHPSWNLGRNTHNTFVYAPKLTILTQHLLLLCTLYCSYLLVEKHVFQKETYVQLPIVIGLLVVLGSCHLLSRYSRVVTCVMTLLSTCLLLAVFASWRWGATSTVSAILLAFSLVLVNTFMSKHLLKIGNLLILTVVVAIFFVQHPQNNPFSLESTHSRAMTASMYMALSALCIFLIQERLLVDRLSMQKIGMQLNRHRRELRSLRENTYIHRATTHITQRFIHSLAQPLTTSSLLANTANASPYNHRLLVKQLEEVNRYVHLSKERLLQKQTPCSNIFTELQEAVELIKPQLKLNNVRLIYYPTDQFFLVQGYWTDHLQSLLQNAVQACKKHVEGPGDLQPTISIRCLMKKGTIILEIKDNGKGMCPSTLKKVCQPYFTTKKEGNGYGLFAACQSALAVHGSLRIRSKVKQGTIVRLKLPRAIEVNEKIK